MFTFKNTTKAVTSLIFVLLYFRDYGLDFLTFRFWTGAWICAMLIVMVATDFSASVAYITRFTEESFSVLISLIFIMEAFKV